MVLAACVLGAISVVQPIVALSIVVCALAIARPAVGLSAALSIEALKLLPVALGVSSSLLTTATGGILLLSFTGSMLHGRVSERGVVLSGSALAAVAGIGIASLVLSSPLLYVLATLNLLLAPMLAALIASGLSEVVWKRFVRFCCVILVLNAVACLWQMVQGTDALVAAGLEYGTTIRQIDGVLRTPGLTLNNSSAGMLAGAAMLVVILTDRALVPVGRAWLLVALAAGSIILLLSTSRSGILLFGVGTVVMLLTSRRGRVIGGSAHGSAWLPRLLFFGIVIMLPVQLVRYGAGSSVSFFSRTSLWERLIQGNVSFLGLGAGRVGGASFSQFNPSAPIFVDNSWLSILIQYGIVGLVVAVAILAVVIVRVVAVRRHALDIQVRNRANVLLAVVCAVLVTGLVIEVLDYNVAMMLVGALAARCLPLVVARLDGAADLETHVDSRRLNRGGVEIG